MENSKITILTVSWYSSKLLQDLINNLVDKAKKPSKLQFLIIDNSNGEDRELENLTFAGITKEILKHNPGNLKNLSAHASGLNYGFCKITTEFTLLIDPDIHVFKQNWDTYLTDQINTKEIDAIGTAYPSWWLGTYHNFPSPVFCFAKTSSLQKVNADWMPEKITCLKKMRNFIMRQILRGAFLFNRRQLIKHPIFRNFTKQVENCLPVCSIDTGFHLAMQAENGNLKAETFKAIYKEDPILSSKIKNTESPAYCELATQYELYSYESEILLTHQYGSQNFLLRTEKGLDRKYWKELFILIELYL
jgi:hypothetical protein